MGPKNFYHDINLFFEKSEYAEPNLQSYVIIFIFIKPVSHTCPVTRSRYTPFNMPITMQWNFVYFTDHCPSETKWK